VQFGTEVPTFRTNTLPPLIPLPEVGGGSKVLVLICTVSFVMGMLGFCEKIQSFYVT
jgi:hypothetical protein